MDIPKLHIFFLLPMILVVKDKESWLSLYLEIEGLDFIIFPLTADWLFYIYSIYMVLKISV